MRVNSIGDLPHAHQRAIIINVKTKIVSTLALLSTLKYAQMPVLLVDCESQDGSLEHFTHLLERYDFDLLSAPMRNHGVTLDWIFGNISADQLLLVDSDLEIKDGGILRFFKEYIDEPTVFGCGFTDGPGWLMDASFKQMNLQGALFHERPWMPLTLFKTEIVRDALNHGKSFKNFHHSNEYTILPYRVRGVLRRLLRRGPAALRTNYGGSRPSVVCYDTGAQIFEYLRYERCLFFVSLPEPVHRRFVTHFFGVTRNVLNPNDTHGGGGLTKIDEYVREQLQSVYGEEF
jgi:glycosyltransferase involved in cell wall biosynthesis